MILNPGLYYQKMQNCDCYVFAGTQLLNFAKIKSFCHVCIELFSWKKTFGLNNRKKNERIRKLHLKMSVGMDRVHFDC